VLATVVVGTLYPLALSALTGAVISVGPPFYALTFVPLVVPLLFLVPFGPLMAWKRGDLTGAAQRLIAAFGIAIAVAIVAAALEGTANAAALGGVALGTWLIAGALSELLLRARLSAIPLGSSFRRLAGLPRSALGTTLAHTGLGVTVLGIVIATTWSSEAIRSMKPGDTVDISGYAVTLDGYASVPADDYSETDVHFSVRQGGAVVATMIPLKRTFAGRQTTTTEVALKNRGFSQLYISLGDIAADGTATVRLYFKPFVTFIWLGAIVMALGGLLSLSDRRLRVGAPRAARARSQAVPAE
jgi:cytochrome c-type biogenesis protein CcmF